MKWFAFVCILLAGCSYRQVKVNKGISNALNLQSKYKGRYTTIRISRHFVPLYNQARIKDTIVVTNTGDTTYYLLYANSAIGHLHIDKSFDSLQPGQAASIVYNFENGKLKNQDGKNEFNFLLIGNTKTPIQTHIIHVLDSPKPII
jgi:hypothetical protein